MFTARFRLLTIYWNFHNVIKPGAGGCPVIRGNKWPSTKWMCMSLIIKLKKVLCCFNLLRPWEILEELPESYEKYNLLFLCLKERMSLLQVPHSSYNVKCSSFLVLQPQHKTSKKCSLFFYPFLWYTLKWFQFSIYWHPVPSRLSSAGVGVSCGCCMRRILH